MDQRKLNPFHWDVPKEMLEFGKAVVMLLPYLAETLFTTLSFEQWLGIHQSTPEGSELRSKSYTSLKSIAVTAKEWRDVLRAASNDGNENEKRLAIEKLIALVSNVDWLGWLLDYSGDSEQQNSILGKLVGLNPTYQEWRDIHHHRVKEVSRALKQFTVRKMAETASTTDEWIGVYVDALLWEVNDILSNCLRKAIEAANDKSKKFPSHSDWEYIHLFVDEHHHIEPDLLRRMVEHAENNTHFITDFLLAGDNSEMKEFVIRHMLDFADEKGRPIPAEVIYGLVWNESKLRKLFARKARRKLPKWQEALPSRQFGARK